MGGFDVFTPDTAPWDSYSVVEGNRFVDRGKVYIFGSTIIAHPDAIDAMRGYGKWRRRFRRLVRWLKWRLHGRPAFRRGMKKLGTASIHKQEES